MTNIHVTWAGLADLARIHQEACSRIADMRGLVWMEVADERSWSTPSALDRFEGRIATAVDELAAAHHMLAVAVDAAFVRYAELES